MAKNTNINQIKYGFLPGLIFPLVMFLLMYFVRYQEVGFTEYLTNLWRFQILMKLMTLCVLPNLVLFLFFFRRKQDMAARGVLMATFAYAFILIISMVLNS